MLLIQRIVSLFILILFLVACNSGSQAPTSNSIDSSQTEVTKTETVEQGFQVVMVQSEIVVGMGRFAIGILDSEDMFVKNANIELTFYDLSDRTNPTLYKTIPAIYREAPDNLAAIYTVEIDFPKAGNWGVIVAGETLQGKSLDERVSFEVAANSPALAVGKKAPLTKSLTLEDVNADLKRLTSAQKPNADFYRLSIDQALSNGKPTIVLFSTPGFCESRICGPDYEILGKVYPSYKDKINFIHVEVYKDIPNPNLSKPQLADALVDWGLQTEPWTYILDKNGVVMWRAEGLITVDELTIIFDSLLKVG